MPTDQIQAQTVHDEIVAILAKETGIAPADLKPEATIVDLGIQSIDLVQAIFAIEERFDVQIPVVPDRAGSEFTTVGQLLDHVLATLERGGPASAPPAARAVVDPAATPPPSSAGTDNAA